jgi:hypothetical protein
MIFWKCLKIYLFIFLKDKKEKKVFETLAELAILAHHGDENGRKRYLFGNQFFL